MSDLTWNAALGFHSGSSQKHSNLYEQISAIIAIEVFYFRMPKYNVLSINLSIIGHTYTYTYLCLAPNWQLKGGGHFPQKQKFCFCSFEAHISRVLRAR